MAPSDDDGTDPGAGAAWTDPGPASEGALAFAREVGLSITVADLLHRRNVEPGATLERWLDPKLAHLTSPADMADLDVGAERITRAIRNSERIAVFGDYDCDGITSATIMTEVITALGGEVTPFIANRFAGGYGFSDTALGRVRESGASLLVTCDCGSSDHERLAAAQKAGIDTVVIDHHLVPKETLPALAFLNPHRPDCGFPYKGLASCGLALFVATALRKRFDIKLDVRRWLDLVAVGTIADVAPLDGDNRALVRAGLKVLSQGSRVGLAALVSQATRGRKRPMSAEDVAYQVAPRINAPGRLGDPIVAMQALMATDPAEAWSLAERVEAITVRRRELQHTMIEEAAAEVQERFTDAPALVLARQGWSHGIVGIVAGRLTDQTGKPCIVVGLEGDRGRGSARAPTGFRLYDAIAASAESLVGFGGHQAAAGIEILAERVDEFREAFHAACAQQLSQMPPIPPTWSPDVRLDERDDLAALVADLERLEPCGEGNRAPKVLIEGATVQSVRVIKGHLKLELRLPGKPQTIGAFGPEMGDRADGLEGAQVNLVGKLKRDHWRGGDAVEVLLMYLERR
jgi:single-stranded-DNA-specific exonuclease